MGKVPDSGKECKLRYAACACDDDSSTQDGAGVLQQQSVTIIVTAAAMECGAVRGPCGLFGSRRNDKVITTHCFEALSPEHLLAVTRYTD